MSEFQFHAPEVPDFDKMRATFRAAVVAGKDGRPEYVTWRDAWLATAEAVREVKQAEFDAYRVKEARQMALEEEGHRLKQLTLRVDTWLGSADRGNIYYSAQRHEAEAAKWRAEVATHLGRATPDDYEVSGILPSLHHEPVSRFVLDPSAEPGTYSAEVDLALNAAVGIE